MTLNADAELANPPHRDADRAKLSSASPLSLPVVSFEFFPPTDPAMESTLWQSIQRLASLRPHLVSVTYGADGSTRDRTREVVRRLQANSALTVAPHVTSIGSSPDELKDLIRAYWGSGIRHLVALRGDLPSASTSAARLNPANTGRSGVEVVELARSVADFDIAVAAYPEVHPEAKSARADLDHLKRKIDAGATRAITQFFYGDDVFLRFRDTCASAGITVPIVPGILPINRFSQVKRFARRSGASIPAWLDDLFAGLDEDAETSRLLGAAVAREQVENLKSQGVTHFHFYTLNRAELTYAACHALGVRERGAPRVSGQDPDPTR